MDIVQSYGHYVRKQIGNHPAYAQTLIRLGLAEESFRLQHLPSGKVPKGYQALNAFAMKKTLQSLQHPSSSAWVNVFAPVELLSSFGLNCTSIELLSSFLSGFYCEDALIDFAETAGIAPTLCSYHKNFIGASLSDTVPSPAVCVTTSMLCDGNINTFRLLSQEKGIPFFLLDIPQDDSLESEEYVLQQLRDLVVFLEHVTGRRYDEALLSQMLERENESKKLFCEITELQKTIRYPNTMTLLLFLIHITHLSIGTEEALQIFRLMRKDIESYPVYQGKRIFWIHLFPYYQQTLQSLFNLSDKWYISGYDFNLDYTAPLDPADPLRSLARKMVGNQYNGPFSRRIPWLVNLVRDSGADGAVYFCHWGCKQISGGARLVHDALVRENIPCLILDGDALDRRNSQDGQLKTRMEAFLEILDAKGGSL